MEGLSAAASGVAVVSVAMQLAESFKKLCDFWKSIKEAPDNIRAISVDLELLSSVLTQIAHETQHVEPDATLIAALNGCCVKVKTLTTLLNDIEPGFASSRPHVRKWTALKAVMKQGELVKFQEALDRLKGTLLLAQQDQNSRLSRIRQNSLELSLATMIHKISRLSVQQYLEIDGSHPSVAFNALRADELHATDLYAGNAYMAQIDSSPSGENWSVPQKQATVRRTLGVTNSVLKGFLGTIRANSTTILQTSRQTADLKPYYEQDQHEYKTSYTISPAPWLVRLGVHYGLHLSFLSSTQGWKNTLRTFCPVPDDALIFEFCKQGNIPAVRSLLSGDHASVRDTDSRGYTPLHFAAENHHPELCQILKSAGADMTLLTRYAETPICLAADRMTRAGVTNSMLSQISNTFRVLINSMDFLEEDSDGWQVLNDLCISVCVVGGSLQAKIDILLWMLQLFLFELKTNVIESKYANMLGWLLTDPELAGVVDLLVNLGGANIIDAAPDDGFNYPPLHYTLAYAEPEYYVSAVITRGPNLHQVCFCDLVTPYEESPTSLAMYSSVAFSSWVHALVKTKVDFESFIDQELDLNHRVHVGWEKETLLDLFLHGDRPNLHLCDFSACSDCMGTSPYVGRHGRPLVQPYWLHLLERIKGGLHPFDPAPADSEDDEDETTDHSKVGKTTSSSTDLKPELNTMKNVPLNNLDKITSKSKLADYKSEYSAIGSDCLYGKHEVVCIDCWLYYQRTGTRGPQPPEDLSEIEDSSSSDDSSECEYSPLLIHS